MVHPSLVRSKVIPANILVCLTVIISAIAQQSLRRSVQQYKHVTRGDLSRTEHCSPVMVCGNETSPYDTAAVLAGLQRHITALDAAGRGSCLVPALHGSHIDNGNGFAQLQMVRHIIAHSVHVW